MTDRLVRHRSTTVLLRIRSNREVRKDQPVLTKSRNLRDQIVATSRGVLQNKDHPDPDTLEDHQRADPVRQDLHLRHQDLKKAVHLLQDLPTVDQEGAKN